MTISRGLLLGFTALWIAGCIGVPPDESDAVFSNPAAYLGKHVRLCGYFHYHFEDTNVWPSRAASLRGERELGLEGGDEARARKLDGKSTCIRAEIVRTGLGIRTNPDGTETVSLSTAMSAEFAAKIVD